MWTSSASLSAKMSRRCPGSVQAGQEGTRRGDDGRGYALPACSVQLDLQSQTMKPCCLLSSKEVVGWYAALSCPLARRCNLRLFTVMWGLEQHSEKRTEKARCRRSREGGSQEHAVNAIIASTRTIVAPPVIGCGVLGRAQEERQRGRQWAIGAFPVQSSYEQPPSTIQHLH